MWMGAAASCNAGRAMPYTIDGQTLSLPPQATHTHPLCRPAEVAFDWPGTQEPETVHPNHGEHYTIVRGDSGAFQVELG